MKNVHLTKFEKSVYRAVMEIPLGETRTYQWVAQRIGNHKSARAVGNALNKNPFAPYIPCHRVIASCGTLGGYRGGLKKKAELLKKERSYLSFHVVRSTYHAKKRKRFFEILRRGT
jgi:O-6-methylguanine DNA methyltransferase